MLKTALKPRWIGFLLLTLAVASVFVLLTKWQFEQSTSNQPRAHEVTETPVELTDHFQPGVPMMSDQADQMVTFTGQLDPHKSVQVESRLHDGVQGLWLVSSASVQGAADNNRIPVVWGWIAEEIQATGDELTQLFEDSTGLSATDTIQFTGRLIPGEGPTPNTNHFIEPQRTQMLATAELVNLWNEPLYAGYVVAETFAVNGIEHVVSGAGVEGVETAPQPEEAQVAWLNVFYAIEWFTFAIFSLYLWWRFVRDDHMKELREAELDELWEEHWKAKELQRLREQARQEKAAAERAYRAYHGHGTDEQKDE